MENRFSCNAGRAKLVDPNNFGLTSSDNISVPLEDLNVSVILKSFRKGRTLLTGEDNGGVSENIAKIDVNFIEGSELGGKKVLTSKFTDLTTVFDKNVINDETLGITSIDIEFNSSYVPMITINFVDVRGSSIFQNEENILNNRGNKYTTFFQLPYPMFELEIKGFYGLPVKYCLHLLKFNSKFNSQTGNFEITCQFIGYTFALLADMLIGYLRAIPWTKIGAERFQKYKDDTGRNILTLDELARKISDINEGLKRQTEENPASQQIETIKESQEYLTSIKDNIKTLGIDIDLNKDKTYYDYIIFQHVSDFNSEQKTAIDTKYIENVKNNIKIYNEKVDEIYKLTEADFINIKTETNTNGGKLYKKVTIEELSQNDEETNNDLLVKFGCKDGAEVNGVKTKLLDTILKLNKGVSDRQELDVFDMTLLNKKIDELTQTLSTKLKEEERTLAEAFADTARKELTFEPTIRPIVEIFTAAIEVLAETIYQVSKSAEENSERTEELAQKFTTQDLNVGDYHGVFIEEKSFFPWPDYREKENSLDKLNSSETESLENTSVYVEKYLGAEGVLTSPEKVDEIVFIEDLLQAFRISYKKQQETINDAETSETTWIPINAFDSFLFSDTEPYERYEFLNTNDIIRLMVIRAMTFLGYSYNPTLLSEEELAGLAQIEVDAILRGVKDAKLKKSLSDTPIEAYKDVKGTINGVERNVIKTGGAVTYDYIFKDIEWKLLPLNKGFNNEIYDVDASKLVKKRDDDGYIFFTNYSSAYDDANDKKFYKKDDGGTYIKIVDTLQTAKALYEAPQGVTTDSVIVLEKIKQENVDKTAGFNPFGGQYGVQEFVKMDWGEPSLSSLPLMYVFYRDCDSGLALTRKASGAAQKLKFDTTSEFFYNGKTLFKKPDDAEEVFKTENDNYVHFNLGKNRTLFNHYLNGGAEEITYPYIEMRAGIPDTKWYGFVTLKEPRQPYTDNAFSLFGSDIYYRQAKHAYIRKNNGNLVACAEYSRAYLFLQTLPFNTNMEKGSPFKNEEIINLFKNSSGIIHVPKMWCAYIGSILWRNSSADPEIENGKIVGGGAGLFKYDDYDQDPISWGDSVNKPGRGYFTSFLDVNGDFNLLFNYDIDKTDLINRLPIQVIKEFKKIFFDFVNGTGSGVKWRDLADKLELFNTSNPNSYSDFWSYLTKVKKTNSEGKISVNDVLDFASPNGTFNKSNVSSFYDIVTSIDDTVGNLQNYTLFLELRDGTSVVKTLIKSLTEEVFIVNSTYRIWGSSLDDKERTPIEVEEAVFNGYFGKVVEILKSKSSELSPSKENEKADLAIFGTTNQETIKLQLYRTCKNIYDKWLGGAKDIDNLIFQCGGRSLTDSKLAKKYNPSASTSGGTRMIDSFRFVSRSFRDIGDQLYINPLPINETLLENTNTSSYDMISKLLAANNFTFQPLPNFINFNDEKVMTSIFRPFNYGTDYIPEGACGPSFVCVYVGQASKHLDYGHPSRTSDHSSKYPNDGFDLRCFNGSSIAPDAPADFISGEGPKEYEEPVSAFVVKYSQQNQNIFKDIHLDQSEFSETDESLKIQDEIAQKGSENNRAVGGQNIYNVYAVRSYTAKVEMMGNAMIQPMMYFQLDNIPMFHGAYLITNVSHSIRPNSMSTNFQGTRVRYPETPLVTAYDIYMDLLSAFDTSDAGTGVVNAGGGGGTIDAAYDVIPDKEVAGKFVNPYEGTATINSVPGLRTLDGRTRQHKGIDFGMKAGRNLVAVYDGVIESVAFNDGGFGLYIVINHGVIGDKTYKTIYGHMSDISSKILGRTRENFTNDDVNKILKNYNPNLKVKKGEIIGKSGGAGGPYLQGTKYNTSGLSTGAHLHWELRIGGKNDSGTNVFSLQPVSGLRFIPAGKDYDYGDTNKIVKEQTVPSNDAETKQFMSKLLKKLNAPETDGNLLFLAAWSQIEGGNATWNPFNSTQPKQGATNYNSKKVKNYKTMDDGVSATYETMTNGNYPNLLIGLRAGLANKQAAYNLAVKLQQKPAGDFCVWVKGPKGCKNSANGLPPNTYVAQVLSGKVRGRNIPKPK